MMKKIKSIFPETVKTAIFVFIVVLFILLTLTGDPRKEPSTFWEGLLIEAYGMLFDILIIGIVILYLNEWRERKLRIRRHHEEIEDFRGWNEKEAMYRTAGIVKRLNRLGETKINLENCFLDNANLKDVRLIKSNLDWASFKNADLQNSILESSCFEKTGFSQANLKEANLREGVFKGTDFRGADLSDVNLSNVNIESHFPKDWLDRGREKTDMTSCRLIGTKFNNSIISDVNFKASIVGELDLSIRTGTCIVSLVDFSNSILKNCNLMELKLIWYSNSVTRRECEYDSDDKESFIIKILVKAKSLYGSKLESNIVLQLKEKKPEIFERIEIPYI